MLLLSILHTPKWRILGTIFEVLRPQNHHNCRKYPPKWAPEIPILGSKSSFWDPKSQKYPQIDCLSMVSEENEMVFSTSLNEPEECPCKKKSVQKAFTGRTSLSEISFTEENLPFISIATPIKRIGRIERVICGRLSWL